MEMEFTLLLRSFAQRMQLLKKNTVGQAQCSVCLEEFPQASVFVFNCSCAVKTTLCGECACRTNIAASERLNQLIETGLESCFCSRSADSRTTVAYTAQVGLAEGRRLLDFCADALLPSADDDIRRFQQALVQKRGPERNWLRPQNQQQQQPQPQQQQTDSFDAHYKSYIQQLAPDNLHNEPYSAATVEYMRVEVFPLLWAEYMKLLSDFLNQDLKHNHDQILSYLNQERNPLGLSKSFLHSQEEEEEEETPTVRKAKRLLAKANALLAQLRTREQQVCNLGIMCGVLQLRPDNIDFEKKTLMEVVHEIVESCQFRGCCNMPFQFWSDKKSFYHCCTYGCPNPQCGNTVCGICGEHGNSADVHAHARECRTSQFSDEEIRRDEEFGPLLLEYESQRARYTLSPITNHKSIALFACT